MAKIVQVLTRPSKEYRQSVADSQVRDLDAVIQKLNTTTGEKDYKIFTNEYDEIIKAENLENAKESAISDFLVIGLLFNG